MRRPATPRAAPTAPEDPIHDPSQFFPLSPTDHLAPGFFWGGIILGERVSHQEIRSFQIHPPPCPPLKCLHGRQNRPGGWYLGWEGVPAFPSRVNASAGFSVRQPPCTPTPPCRQSTIMGDCGPKTVRYIHGLSAAPVSQLHCLLATDVPRGDGCERIRPLPQDAPTVVDAGKFAECKTGPLDLIKLN